MITCKRADVRKRRNLAWFKKRQQQKVAFNYNQMLADYHEKYLIRLIDLMFCCDSFVSNHEPRAARFLKQSVMIG